MLYYLAAVEEPHVSAALVQLKPAALDRHLDACSELRAAAAVLVHEQPVDLFDMDAAVLDGVDGGGELNQLTLRSQDLHRVVGP